MLVSTADMTYCRELKRFVVEASQVDRGAHSFWYDGLTLLSHRTGRKAAFQVQRRVMCGGDVAAWVLAPSEETLQLMPWMAGITVHVLNT
jgi:hypothetical protein